MSERLEYLKAHYKKQEKVKVEVPAQHIQTIKGTVTYRFNGMRAGYEFKDGIAWIAVKDLHKFQQQPFIIYDEEEGKEK